MGGGVTLTSSIGSGVLVQAAMAVIGKTRIVSFEKNLIILAFLLCLKVNIALTGAKH